MNTISKLPSQESGNSAASRIAMTRALRHTAIGLLTLIAIACAVGAQAQTTIDQDKALAGNVTAGDAPGFPVTISASGSYKLTSNLVVPSATNGIAITASDVTLDLNGYTISGSVVCTGKGLTIACMLPQAGNDKGVRAYPGVTDVRVINGSIEGFSETALLLNKRSFVDRINTRFTGGYGIMVGADSVIARSRATRSAKVGIYSQGGLVFDSIADGNGQYGILMDAADTSILRSNIASHNGMYGLASTGAALSSFVDNHASETGIYAAFKWPGNTCTPAAFYQC